MEIREARVEEIEELMIFFDKMNRVINERNNDYNPDNEIYPPRGMVAAAIEDHQQLVGIEDEKIVLGCIINSNCPEAYYSANWKVSAGNDEFWVIHALRVDTDYEGRGFAKQLLSYITELAPKYGIKALRLDVLEGYAVERLYTNSGFEYIDTIEILYNDIGYPKKFRLLEKSVGI